MMKRVIALVLCLATVLICLTACSHGENDKGAYIRMYLTEKIYDFDPIEAYDNEAALQIVDLLFEGLFSADENGKPEKNLVEDYEYTEDEKEGEYILSLTLKNTHWSDGVLLTANHVYFSFYRLLAESHPATVLLYDIKNARAIAEGNDSLDHLGVTVVNNTTIEISFEKPIEVDEFLVNLCSPALYPVRDDIVESNGDWAKKSSTIVCSGPFMLRSNDYEIKDGFILERNSYYYRDRSKDDLDKYVTPYRLVVDYYTDPVEQLKLFDSEEAGALYYFGHIAIEARDAAEFAEIFEGLEITAAPSTHTYYLNQNAVINGKALFADANVRKALSLVIDRDAIAEAIVYAEAADGIVPKTLLDRPGKKATFRENAESYIASTANTSEAESLLSEAGVKASNYSFSITVASYDEDHIAMAELVQAAWSSLGFKVTINALKPYEIINYVDADGNPDTPPVAEATGIYENPYKNALETMKYTVTEGDTTRLADVEVIALDLVATSPNTFTYLAPFATAFSGNGFVQDATTKEYSLLPHITGYSSEDYDAKIEEAYAADNAKERAALLHEAEAMLMEDMPAIPIVYNQNISLKSSKLKGVDRSFFCNAVFTEAKLSGYWKIALRDEFVVEEDESNSGEEVSA